MIIVYGRRRVGKTELLEQVFRQRKMIKFEGLENKTGEDQKKHVLYQWSQYKQDPLIAKLQLATWKEIFELIGESTIKGKWTLYFEEVQWLAQYEDDFISELKYVWDNYFRYNPKLIIILCGSSPSFMIQKVLHSKALYNRSQHELHLREFNLIEARQLLGEKRSDREIMDAYLALSGIPEYLKRIRPFSSTFLGICHESFREGGFFSHEYKRIFTSGLAGNKHYQKIIRFLSTRKFSTRNEIIKHIKINLGGTLTQILEDLELCGFIKKYTPYNLNEKSLLSRYTISDAYLQFYFKFISPLQKNIDQGDYNNQPASAIKHDTYLKWLGFSFERFCRDNHKMIARILGFEAVRYKHGAFFNRAAQNEDSGYQIDLIFERDDGVYTVCEIKYLQDLVPAKVIHEFEKKLSLFPNPKNKTIHKVLITSHGADKTLNQNAYFDNTVTLKDFFDMKNWS